MSQPWPCFYRAQSCCRHFMVKLLDDGSFMIPGEKRAHASLDALVTFHQQQPMRPHGELLKQPCGQVSVGTLVGWDVAALPGAKSSRLMVLPPVPFSLLWTLSFSWSLAPAPPLLVLACPPADFSQGFTCRV